MADLIDRQAAIRSVCEKECRVLKPCNAECGSVIALRELPSVEAEPVRQGQWVYGEDDHGIDGYHCNKCGFFVPWDYTHKFINFIEDYNYCPHCNARMDLEDVECIYQSINEVNDG